VVGEVVEAAAAAVVRLLVDEALLCLGVARVGIQFGIIVGVPLRVEIIQRRTERLATRTGGRTPSNQTHDDDRRGDE
jgi:hypothetical protein